MLRPPSMEVVIPTLRTTTCLLALPLVLACQGSDSTAANGPSDLPGYDGDGADALTGARVEGRISDSSGAQLRLAGAGSIDAAERVESYTMIEDDVVFFAEATVDADGSYAVEVPEATSWVLVQGIDADGQVVGSVVVAPSIDEVRYATPMTVESSMEAEVFRALDGDPEQLWPHVRQRVDATTSVTASTWMDVDLAVDILADAVEAAAAAQVMTWTDADVDLDQLDDDRMDATLELSHDLHEGDVDAYEDFISDLAEAEARAESTGLIHARAEATASLAYRAALDAHGAVDLLASSVRIQATTEAAAWEQAISPIMLTLGADSDELIAALVTTEELRDDLGAAMTRAEMQADIDQWRDSLLVPRDDEGLVWEVLEDDEGLELLQVQALVSAEAAGQRTTGRVLTQANLMANGEIDPWTFGTRSSTIYARERGHALAELTLLTDLTPSMDGVAAAITSSQMAFLNF